MIQDSEYCKAIHVLYDILQQPGLLRQKILRDTSRSAEQQIVNPDELFQFQSFCGELERFIQQYTKPE